MKELSLNILDILENSIHAKANNVWLFIEEYTDKKDLFSFTVKDDGKGMDETFLASVFDPFTTTSTTKSVGLGLPLLKGEAEMSGGGAKIQSEVGKGTIVSFWFQHSHWDRPPLGDIAGTVLMMFLIHSSVSFTFKHQVNENSFLVSTTQLLDIFEGVPLSNPKVISGIQSYISSSIQDLYGGKHG